MKIEVVKIAGLILLLLLISCDPPHYINFINKSNSSTRVKLSLKAETKFYDLEQLSVGDSIVFSLKQEESADIHFGIGSWRKTEILIEIK